MKLNHVALLMIRFLFPVTLLFALKVNAQDTFHVKKKVPTADQVTPNVVYADTTVKDSIISYTVQYKKPGSNIWVVLHQQGPYLIAPTEAMNGHERVLFTEIIAMDKNGRRYHQPDRYFSGGIWVDAPKK